MQDEAAIAGRLQHPHVVEVLGLWSDRVEGGPSRWVLVSERVRGIPLHELGVLPPEAVVALGLELVDALQAAQRVGLSHGDVRPGNVLAGRAGRRSSTSAARLATDATQLRPGETAPERLDGGPPTAASDVYGLAVVLHHVLHGRLPFAGETPWAIIGAQRTLPEVVGPRGLAALLKRMLHPDPVERPALSVVREALERLRLRPDRRVSLRQPLPAIRPGRPWVVHGIDPVTGAPALVRSGLSKAQAKALLARLRADGWQVRGIREAFGWRDLTWIAGCTLVGALLLPVVGSVPALFFAARWRAEGVRPGIGVALPPVAARVPRRPPQTGSETTVVVGLLLLTAAVCLLWWPPLAVVPLVLLVAMLGWSMRPAPAPAEVIARQGHVQASLARARSLLDARVDLGTDLLLGLAGEVDALESGWRTGEVDADRLLVQVDELLLRVPAAAPSEVAREARPAALDALRRARETH
ncbi:MAG: hypothetical protein R3F59_10490 [Myxococcota bacterium]